MQKKGDYEGEKVTLRWISISIQDTQTILWGYDIEKKEGCKKGGRETEAEEERRADWRTGWCGIALTSCIEFWLHLFKYSLKLKKHKGACVCVCLYLILFCILPHCEVAKDTSYYLSETMQQMVYWGTWCVNLQYYFNFPSDSSVGGQR